MAPSNSETLATIDLEQGPRRTWFSGLLTLSLLLVCIRASCRLQRFYLSLSERVAVVEADMGNAKTFELIFTKTLQSPLNN
ncbi:hypothetical protein OG21DRAFT_1518321 [Imleria badia]|nr:hypothetical protein OG21DRAFT_1518321 [Imleria badia]